MLSLTFVTPKLSHVDLRGETFRVVSQQDQRVPLSHVKMRESTLFSSESLLNSSDEFGHIQFRGRFKTIRKHSALGYKSPV